MGLKNTLIEASKVVATPAGILNKAQFSLKQLLDPQFKNVFEMVMYPSSFSFSPLKLASAALDTVVVQLHVQTVTIPFIGVTYDRAENIQYAKEMARPEACSFILMENDLAFVRNYYDLWWLQVVAKKTDIFGNSKYVFKDNQSAARKNAMIFLQTGTGLPSPAWLKLEGLRPQSLEELTIGHGEADPYMVRLTCALDDAYLETAVGKLYNLF